METDNKPNNPLAFPFSQSSDACYFQDGMTLRDYFANSALQGHLASEYYTGMNTEEDNLNAIAKNMYAFADAMLKQREL